MKKFYFIIIILFLSDLVYSQNISVLTHRYSNYRTGWNNNETILNTSNVNDKQFGLIFTRQVDDQCYATPLIVSDVTINGKTQNVLYIATMNNSVYAFDADDSANTAPLFHVNVKSPGNRDLQTTDLPCTNYGTNIGIISTPVIDTISKTIYVISNEHSTGLQQAQQYFHALDITTGKEKSGSPVLIQTYVIGKGDGSKNDTLYFNPIKNNQRAALILYNGFVYASWAGFCDIPPYHGWIMGFDASTYKLKYTYNSTPNGSDGGIWLGGNGPSADDEGNIYFVSGNGTVGDSVNPNYPGERGQSLIKLRPNGDSLQLVDFFTPYNYAYLDTNDLDYGSGTAVLIPDSKLSLSIGKEGKMYLLNDTKLGRYSTSDDSVIQSMYVTPVYNFPQWTVYGSPVYYDFVSQNDSEYVYVWASFDTLKQFYFNRTTMSFDLTKTIYGKEILPDDNYGPVLSGSGNGTLAGTGILWVLRFTTGVYSGNALLEAYDARNVQKLLWTSNSPGNNMGSYTKFIYPVVANGKVYICANSNSIYVYGLKPNSLTGTNISSLNTYFLLYPNPANDIVNLKYSLISEVPNLTISFCDLYGRKLLSFPLSGTIGENFIALNVNNQLMPGIYYVIINSGEDIYNLTKLVIY